MKIFPQKQLLLLVCNSWLYLAILYLGIQPPICTPQRSVKSRLLCGLLSLSSSVFFTGTFKRRYASLKNNKTSDSVSLCLNIFAIRRHFIEKLLLRLLMRQVRGPCNRRTGTI